MSVGAAYAYNSFIKPRERARRKRTAMITAMDAMTGGAMNTVFEAAARQLFTLALVGSVCAMALMMAACSTAGILRRLR